MASLTLRRLQIAKSLKIYASLRYISTSQPLYGDLGSWYKDFKPGPHPESEKEAAASAKKYNLLPKDYKNYPKDYVDIGDYPYVEAQARIDMDPHADFDYPELQRNFGEVIPKDDDYFMPDRINPKLNQLRFSWQKQVLAFFGVLGFLFIGVFGGPQLLGFRLFRPEMPKQYPYKLTEGNLKRPYEPEYHKCFDQTKHFTFEKSSS